MFVSFLRSWWDISETNLFTVLDLISVTRLLRQHEQPGHFVTGSGSQRPILRNHKDFLLVKLKRRLYDFESIALLKEIVSLFSPVAKTFL